MKLTLSQCYLLIFLFIFKSFVNDFHYYNIDKINNSVKSNLLKNVNTCNRQEINVNK